MAMSNVFPVHAVNKYLWHRLSDEASAYEGDRPGESILSRYNNIVPIVPVEEVPDLMQAIDSQPGVGSRPYIVYAWNRVNSQGAAWYLKTHQIAYAVRSADDDKMRQTINLFEQEFQDQDRAALRLNAYLGSLPEASPLKRFQFKYLNISSLGGQLPAEVENGVSESLITVSATFTGQDVYYGQ